jgi:hypothetical protein
MLKSTDLIGKVLSPALRLWLRSQVESVAELNLAIQGKDRQILTGYIPSVSLNSSRAVYQGLHLGEVELLGENIRINIGQILKGKPLQLLEPIQVTGQVRLAQTDLQASLSSSLLASAFRDLLEMVLQESGVESASQHLENSKINWHGIILQSEGFILKGMRSDSSGQVVPVAIQASLKLIDGQTLGIIPVQMEGFSEFAQDLQEFAVDLGKDVTIEEFSLVESQLFCCGRLTIYN